MKRAIALVLAFAFLAPALPLYAEEGTCRIGWGSWASCPQPDPAPVGLSAGGAEEEKSGLNDGTFLALFERLAAVFGEVFQRETRGVI